MNQYCFEHPERASLQTCKQCGKTYCGDCLSLVGAIRVPFCSNCLIVFQTHRARKEKAALALIVLSPLMFIATVVGLSTEEALNWVVIDAVLLLASIGTFVLGLVGYLKAKRGKPVLPYETKL